MVRCKVVLLQAEQRAALTGAATDAQAQAARCLGFCARGMEPGTAALIITHGFSGSGKSTLCDTLVELLGALQIRADIERKRMHDLAPGAGAAAAPGAGIYNPQASRATYRRLARLVRQVSAAGLSLSTPPSCRKHKGASSRRWHANLACHSSSLMCGPARPPCASAWQREPDRDRMRPTRGWQCWNSN